MAKKGPVEVPWHSNFSDASHLPDIKPVRSIFFINFAPMALAITLLFYWLFIEWQIGSLNVLLSADQSQIAFHKKLNEQLLKESAEFERWAKLINEIQSFVGVPFKPSQFLVAMADARPAQMTLSQISYAQEPRQEAAPPKVEKSDAASKDAKETSEKKVAPKNFSVYSIIVSGSVTGTSQQATRNIDAFRDRLEKIEIFKGLKIQSKPLLKQFERDKSLDLYTFTITMEVRV